MTDQIEQWLDYKKLAAYRDAQSAYEYDRAVRDLQNAVTDALMEIRLERFGCIKKGQRK